MDITYFHCSCPSTGMPATKAYLRDFYRTSNAFMQKYRARRLRLHKILHIEWLLFYSFFFTYFVFVCVGANRCIRIFAIFAVGSTILEPLLIQFNYSAVKWPILSHSVNIFASMQPKMSQRSCRRLFTPFRCEKLTLCNGHSSVLEHRLRTV